MLSQTEYFEYREDQALPEAFEAIHPLRWWSPQILHPKRDWARFYSVKMGRTFQFDPDEALYALLYSCEIDDSVHEYYLDQVRPSLAHPDLPESEIDASYPGYNLRLVWVLGSDTVRIIEAISERRIGPFVRSNPEVYQFDNGGSWHNRPGEEYARRLGLANYHVLTDADMSPIFRDNMRFLMPHLRNDLVDTGLPTRSNILSHLKGLEGVRLGTVYNTSLHKLVTRDQVNTLMAQGEIATDINETPAEQFEAIRLLEKFPPISSLRDRKWRFTAKSANMDLSNLVGTGLTLTWGAREYDIFLPGGTDIILKQQQTGRFLTFFYDYFCNLINFGNVTDIHLSRRNESSETGQQSSMVTSARDLTIAIARYRRIEPYLDENLSERQLTRLFGSYDYIYKLITEYHEAERRFGSGFIGLLPPPDES
jgi:hypothetical protein